MPGQAYIVCMGRTTHQRYIYMLCNVAENKLAIKSLFNAIYTVDIKFEISWNQFQMYINAGLKRLSHQKYIIHIYVLYYNIFYIKDKITFIYMVCVQHEELSSFKILLSSSLLACIQLLIHEAGN